MAVLATFHFKYASRDARSARHGPGMQEPNLVGGGL